MATRDGGRGNAWWSPNGAAELSIPAEIACHRPNVLVLDDDVELGAELVSALKVRGIDATHAIDVREVPRQLLSTADVILLDLAMPFDGFQTIDRLKMLNCDPEIIVSSGESGRIVSTAGAYISRAGLRYSGAFHKPYSVEDLARHIRRGDTERSARRGKMPVADLIEAPAPGQGISVVFQGKYRISSREAELIGYEALTRPGGGLSADAMFAKDVPTAVQKSLTLGVVAHAASFHKAREALGISLPIAINVSPKLFLDVEFMESLPGAAESMGLPPAMLTVELTEREAIDDPVMFAAIASRLVMRGVPVAIDDFGRGSAGFEWLIGIPATELKIDKEFFWNCFSGAMPAKILSGILEFCQQHALAVTIEGVESQAHMTFARYIGARQCQGYFFGQPMTLEQWADLDRHG